MLNGQIQLKFNIFMPLSEELCEIIGLFIGDRFFNKHGSRYTIQFTGNIKEEKYYQEVIIPKFNSIFGLKPYIRRKHKIGAIRASHFSKSFFKTLLERFNFKTGKKITSVLIPLKIFKSKFLAKTIRGIYDVDGYVYPDNRKIYAKSYPRIELRMNNFKLIKQIRVAIEKFNVKTYLRDQITLVVQGEQKIKKFIKEIGFSNYKHLTRISRL